LNITEGWQKAILYRYRLLRVIEELWSSDVNKLPWLDAAGAVMWALVDRHTGYVGWKGGTKASGLNANSPVIDCSGWAALLLSAGMSAANGAVTFSLFSEMMWQRSLHGLIV